MKKCLISLFLCVVATGCTSKPPKQPQPEGLLMPVHPLQGELNERPKRYRDGEMRLIDKHYEEMSERHKRMIEKEEQKAAKAQNKTGGVK